MLHTSLESLSPDAIRARDAFLALINPSHKSHVTNLFLEQARAGLRKPSDIVARVLAVVTQRLAAAEDDSERQKWTAIRAVLVTPDALDFAAYAVHYAALPGETRARMKATRQADYLQQHMESHPATNSQLVLLRRLGWTGAPAVNTRAEAAALIGALMAGKGGNRG